MFETVGKLAERFVGLKIGSIFEVISCFTIAHTLLLRSMACFCITPLCVSDNKRLRPVVSIGNRDESQDLKVPRLQASPSPQYLPIVFILGSLGVDNCVLSLGESKCPNVAKPILSALVLCLGFATLLRALSPIEDISEVKRVYFVKAWIPIFDFDHLFFPDLAFILSASTQRRVDLFTLGVRYIPVSVCESVPIPHLLFLEAFRSH
jgi:hypothetical protein